MLCCAVLCCVRVRIKPVVPTSEPTSLSIEYITVVTRMSSCIGILQEYAVGDDWEDYTDHLKQYFVENKMDTDEDAQRRRAVSLTVCGAPRYSLIKDLLAPAKPSDKSYEELVNLVKRYYHPKPGKIVSRYKFYTHHGQEGQLASDSLADLRRIAEHCEFTDKLEEMLHDFSIIGINDDSILQKLLTESNPNLAKVMEIATACMKSAENLRVISN